MKVSNVQVKVVENFEGKRLEHNSFSINEFASRDNDSQGWLASKLPCFYALLHNCLAYE